MNVHKPTPENLPAWYRSYVALVPQLELPDAFAQHQKSLLELLQKMPAEKWNYRYAVGKWTVKEMIQHIIDTDRIFNYRALAFARKETAALPGYDENSYALASNANNRTPTSLIEETKAVQRSSALLFDSFGGAQFEQSGMANGNSISVAAIGFILIGHTLHHINVLKERYL